MNSKIKRVDKTESKDDKVKEREAVRGINSYSGKGAT